MATGCNDNSQSNGLILHTCSNYHHNGCWALIFHMIKRQKPLSTCVDIILKRPSLLSSKRCHKTDSMNRNKILTQIVQNYPSSLNPKPKCGSICLIWPFNKENHHQPLDLVTDLSDKSTNIKLSWLFYTLICPV